MQGRPDPQGERWDKLTSQKMAALNGSGKQRAIPQRPPGMGHLDTPPAMTRVARPQRSTAATKTTRRRLIIVVSIFAVVGILACVIGSLLASGILSSAGPASTITDFLGALNSKNYDQAYKDLGPAITLTISQEQFTQQAKALDNCYGPVTSYPIVDNSATNVNNIQSYTYTITRSKLAKPYQMTIRVQQDQDDANSWKISSYGTTLGPGQPAPACSK